MIWLFSVISIFPFVSADIISVNAGGNTEFIVSTGGDIENFFFGIPSVPEVEEESSDSSSSSSSGSSSGSGGSGTVVTETLLEIDPSEINLAMQINTVERRTIRVTNPGISEITVSVSQEGLNDTILFNQTSLTIPAGGTVAFEASFAAPSEAGSFSGKILIGNNEVLVTLDVYEGLLLFDSNIVVLNDDYSVLQGDNLKTRITLIPMGDPVRLDVTLKFEIKDYRGKVYLTKSETLLSEETVNLFRDFDTGKLPTGDYVVSLELSYPGGIAPSSAHFIVLNRNVPAFVGNIVLLLVIMILAVSIGIVVVLILRRLKERAEIGHFGSEE